MDRWKYIDRDSRIYADPDVYEITASSISDRNQILVTAIVSAYNSTKFFSECLIDLLEQTLYKKEKLEILIIDSASQQNEKEQCLDLLKKYKNITYLRTKQREPLYRAWNRAICYASGKYLTSANTDDRHRVDALEVLSDTLNNNEKSALVYADSVVTTNENEIFECCSVEEYWQLYDFDPVRQIHFAQNGSQPMWRKSLHQQFGYFSDELRICADYDWWLRLAATQTFIHIPELLGLYLNSPTSIEHRDPQLSLNEATAVKNFHAQRAGVTLDFRKYPAIVSTKFYSRRELKKFDRELNGTFIATVDYWSEAYQIAEKLFNSAGENSFELLVCGNPDCSVVEKYRQFSSKLRVRAFKDLRPEDKILSHALAALNASSDTLQFVAVDSDIDLSLFQRASSVLKEGKSQIYIFSAEDKSLTDWQMLIESTVFSSKVFDVLRQANTFEEVRQILKMICKKIEPGFKEL